MFGKKLPEIKKFVSGVNYYPSLFRGIFSQDSNGNSLIKIITNKYKLAYT